MVKALSTSQQVLAYLGQRYGSYDPNAWQSLRKPFWSSVAYPEAGVTSLNFFGTTFGATGQNKWLTNLGQANSFGLFHYWLHSIQCDLLIKTWAFNTFAGENNDTLYSDLINGFVQAGVFELLIGSRTFVQEPKPLLSMPPANGQPQIFTAGCHAMTLTEAAPNTLATFTAATPFATLNRRKSALYLVDQPIFIEAGTPFECKISFPSGLVPVIGTDITDDTTNPLYIKVTFDGIGYRPIQ